MGRGKKGASPDGKKRSMAFTLVLLFGLVSLFVDVANEGARSIIGPYLGILGASAAVVGIVAGLGELIGYSLRIVFGKLADATGNYWAPIFVGYVINLIAVPALALAGDWQAAAALIMLERIGRAMRCPARDAMLSYSGKKAGRGWAFGVQDALSSVGGMLGPAVVVIVMVLGGGYRIGFEMLVIPLLIAMVVLAHAYRVESVPRKREPARKKAGRGEKFPRIFWIYMGAGVLIAAGYSDFPLISLHVGAYTSVPEGWIPILYAVAMATNAITALLFGRLYDHIGMGPLVMISAIVPAFVPMVFSGDLELILLGMMLYGVGFGAQDSMMRAAVADMAPPGREGYAFGLYNAAFGVSWFMGSVTTGLLYGVSVMAMIALSVGLQLMAIPLFMKVRRGRQEPRPGGAGEPVPQA